MGTMCSKVTGEYHVHIAGSSNKSYMCTYVTCKLLAGSSNKSYMEWKPHHRGWEIGFGEIGHRFASYLSPHPPCHPSGNHGFHKQD
jgi:hypothetical protein